MKDFEGNDIKVGDEIVYLRKGRLVRATVREIKTRKREWAVVEFHIPIQQSPDYTWENNRLVKTPKPPITVEKVYDYINGTSYIVVIPK